MEELEISPLHERILALVRKCPGRGRHCAINAVDHVRKAWRLREIDPEMAIFRAITAEEESATAIFYALVRRKYVGASKLRLDDHEHKAAVGPFLDALVEIVTDVPDAEPTVVLSRTPNGERLFTRLSFVDASGQKFVLYPLPPLSGGVSINGDEEALGREFDQALNRIATRARATSIKKHVAGIKNERNKLLYASDRGVARVRELQDWYFTQVRDRVFRNLITYLLIDQHAQKQEFAQEALKAFLRIVWRESRRS
jgi:hypothetical protein